MQTHPTTLVLVARTRVADRQREAEPLRLAKIATARASFPRAGLRSWLASTLRAAADRVQPSVAERPVHAYR
jgi:hypothetical protein